MERLSHGCVAIAAYVACARAPVDAADVFAIEDRGLVAAGQVNSGTIGSVTRRPSMVGTPFDLMTDEQIDADLRSR